MRDSRQIIGKRGEDEACRLLEEMGHTIICRNWRHGHLEIDIISLKENGLHIVEVKSLAAPAVTAPETKVNRSKRAKMVAGAKAFLNSDERKELPADMEVFFDVVSVLFDGPDFEIEYYPQAFIPIYD